MHFSRRKFIQMSSLASAALMVPRFLHALGKTPLPVTGKKLVVIQLSGGNDGLNTVIPYRNDIYYSNRASIAIAKDQALALDTETGLHPALKNLKQLYDEGLVTVLNGVGYPTPDRSHFRSMDIWQTGSGASELLTTGWLGRYLDSACATCDTHNAWALEADDSLSLALKGANRNGIAVQDVKRLYNSTRNGLVDRLSFHAAEHHGQMAGYLYKTLTETTASAGYLYEQTKLYQTAVTYPDTGIGKRLKMIGQLLCSGSETQVYYVSHGSFDTHVDQQRRQEQLFTDLDTGMGSLVADLKANNRMQDVVIMTFSEFGRRVAQNASKGTDHGAANCMFLIGGALKKPGLYNPVPSLTNLDDGDMRHEIDFRRMYATLLGKWLGANATEILGKHFDPLLVV